MLSVALVLGPAACARTRATDSPVTVLPCDSNCETAGCFWFGARCHRRCAADRECPINEACVCPDRAKCLYPTVADEMPNPGKNYCVRPPPSGLEALKRRALLDGRP